MAQSKTKRPLDRGQLSRHEYLQGVALFHMAQTHYAKARQFEAELVSLLGLEDDLGNWIGDQVLEDGGSFDKALKLEGWTVPKKSGNCTYGGRP